MATTREGFLTKYPKLFHVTYASNVEGIRRYGFLSANNIKRAAAEVSGFRRNPRTVNEVILRDQYPMRPEVLTDSILRGSSQDEWYRLIDDHVFFFADKGKAQKLFDKYQKLAKQAVLSVETRDLLKVAQSSVHVTPINTGAIAPAYALRGPETFHPLSTWLQTGFIDRARIRQPSVAEVAVRQPILQVDFSVDVHVTD